MMNVLKAVCCGLYAFAAFAGFPLALVGTGALIVAWLGSAWWVDLIVGFVVCAEFIAGLCFFLWDDNPIPRWLTE